MAQPTIVLVRPREQGNIGAVARAMSNMGLEKLILVEPAPAIGAVARGFGVGGWPILDQAVRKPDLASAIAPFQQLIGTTANRQRRLGSTPVHTPRSFAAAVGSTDQELSTAILFGPEDSGLSRSELELCSASISIPSRTSHPTLNLSQAVLLVAYELFLRNSEHELKTSPNASVSPRTVATAEERQTLIARISLALEAIGYDQASRRRSVLNVLGPLASRGGLSRHELRVLLRVCNRTIGARTTPEPRGRVIESDSPTSHE